MNCTYNCKTKFFYIIIYIYVCFNQIIFNLKFFKCFKQKVLVNFFFSVYIHIYVIMIMMTKWKYDFAKKWDLWRSKHPRIIALRFVGPSLWCEIVAGYEALIIRYSDLARDLSWNRNVIAWFVEYRLSVRKILNQIHAKVGDKNSCILGGLFTIKVKMEITGQ